MAIYEGGTPELNPKKYPLRGFRAGVVGSLKKLFKAVIWLFKACKPRGLVFVRVRDFLLYLGLVESHKKTRHGGRVIHSYI